MKIYLGADHAGYLLKNEIIKHLANNYEVIDCGTNDNTSVDYPDFAKPVCENIKDGNLGILVCYTGIGMSMCANKYKGVRAGLVGKVEDAVLTREHNNANCLCLSAKNTETSLALEIVDAFLKTEFAGGRHERRVNKVMEFENGQKEKE